MKQTITVAAIQMETTFCDTDVNLRTAAEWVRQAQKLGAKWIMLPEFFTSGLAWDPRMRDAWEPLDGKPMQMLKQMAKDGGTVVGGSFLAKSGKHIRNTLVLAVPDGRTFTHDKDIFVSSVKSARCRILRRHVLTAFAVSSLRNVFAEVDTNPLERHSLGVPDRSANGRTATAFE